MHLGSFIFEINNNEQIEIESIKLVMVDAQETITRYK